MGHMVGCDPSARHCAVLDALNAAERLKSYVSAAEARSSALSSSASVTWSLRTTWINNQHVRYDRQSPTQTSLLIRPTTQNMYISLENVWIYTKEKWHDGSIGQQLRVVVHAVHILVCLPTSTKLRVSHSAKKINHRHIIAQDFHIFGFCQTIIKNDQ